MKYITLAFAFLWSSLVWAESTESIQQAVKKTVYDNMRYMEENNLDKAMSTINPDSASYQPTYQLTKEIMDSYVLSYEISNYKFIAYDGELAYARFTLTTKKVSGPPFSNNELDILMILKPYKGKWKIWSQANMGVKFLQ